MLKQQSFHITTPGRGMTCITEQVASIVNQSGMDSGLCNVFLHHTSASVIFCENADISVQEDMERFMLRLMPDGDPLFEHTAEGPDDMPSHVRTILTQNSLVIPITQGKLGLGTWQGIYLWEHRIRSHHRKITITLMG